MQSQIPPYIYILFTAVTSIGVLMQACVLLGIFLGLRRMQAKIERILDPLTVHLIPLVESSKATMEEISPKLKVITSNLAEVSETLKHESYSIRGSVDDVLHRTRAQTARVDEMVSGTLDGIAQAGAAIHHGIEVPLRQINGVLQGFRAGIDVLRRKTPAGRINLVVETPTPEAAAIVDSVVEEILTGKPRI